MPITKQEIIDYILELQAEGKDIPPYNLMEFITSHALLLQRDKAGAAYAFHTAAVTQGTDSKTAKTIRKGHDLIEDSDWTLDDLQTVGFEDRIIAGIDGMTHRKGELYFDSIERCGQNADARNGKLKDLEHNMSQSRNNWLPTDHDLQRIRKYTVAYNYLVAIKKDEIALGTPVHEWMQGQPTKMQDFDLVREHSTKYREAYPSYGGSMLGIFMEGPPPKRTP